MRRILLKLSGEALAGPKKTGFDEETVRKVALQVKELVDQDIQVAVYTTDSRCVIFSTAQLLPKTTRNTQGVSVVSLKKKAAISYAAAADNSGIVNLSRYRTRTLPSAGAILKPEALLQSQAMKMKCSCNS